jgi:hypothetical protein
MDGQRLGVFLLIIAVIGLLFFTPQGKGLVGKIPGVSEPDGNEISCKLTIDKDSIHTGSCDIVDDCRLSAYFGLFDTVTSTERDLNLKYGTKTYASESIDVSIFGTNKALTVGACVPKAATTMEAILTDADNKPLARKTVSIQ